MDTIKTGLLHRDQQAIVAQCTPVGSGAVALIRISGCNAVQIASSCARLSNSGLLSSRPTHTISYGVVVDSTDTHIDQVLFLLMRAPKTFTGQDTVEITCHNNQFIIQQIIDTLLERGALLAQPGEFARRAVMNNKIDVLQAEGIYELIHANSQQALKGSLAQLHGSLSGWIANIEAKLIQCLALSEVSFEFIDEEDLTFGHQITQIIADILKQIYLQKEHFEQHAHIRRGVRIVIIGSVNAGKSSLFNVLLQKDRAIVSDVAGTTRDSIEAGLYKNGLYWTLIDTAGLRQTDDMIEQQGIDRSLHEAQLADIILLACDSTAQPLPDEQAVYAQLQELYAKKIIGVWTKTDDVLGVKLSQAFFAGVEHQVAISSKTGENIDTLYLLMQKKIDKLFECSDTPFLLNQRHFHKLTNLQQGLERLVQMLQGTVEYELVSYHLNDALSHLSELTGKSISQEAMDEVFRNFCVGK